MNPVFLSPFWSFSFLSIQNIILIMGNRKWKKFLLFLPFSFLFAVHSISFMLGYYMICDNQNSKMSIYCKSEALAFKDYRLCISFKILSWNSKLKGVWVLYISFSAFHLTNESNTIKFDSLWIRKFRKVFVNDEKNFN